LGIAGISILYLSAKNDANFAGDYPDSENKNLSRPPRSVFPTARFLATSASSGAGFEKCASCAFCESSIDLL